MSVEGYLKRAWKSEQIRRSETIEDNMSEDKLPNGCKEWIEISSTEKLRDQFFCAALTGLMSSAEYRSIYGSDGQETRRMVVLHAWTLADEALRQRNK